MKLTLEKASRYVSKGLNITPEEILNSFSPATTKDIDGLLELRNNISQGPPPWDDRRYLEWRYSFEDNTNNHNKIWVFKLGGNIQACMGAEEVTLCVNNKKVLAHKAMDLLVKPEIDGKGLGAWMTLVFMEEYATLFATGSTKSSYPMISSLFHEMDHRHTYKLFTKVNAKLKYKIKSELLSNIISAPLNLAISIHHKIIHRERGNAYSLKPLSAIPDQVDTFIDESCEKNHVQRTKKYLDWRFIENTRRDFIVLGLYLNGTLLGVSFSIINKHNDAFIFDWVYKKSADSSNEILRNLLVKTIKHLKKSKPGFISTSAYDTASDIVYDNLGFMKRDYDQTFFTYTSDENIEQYLYDNNRWYLTESDANTDLY